MTPPTLSRKLEALALLPESIGSKVRGQLAGHYLDPDDAEPVAVQLDGLADTLRVLAAEARTPPVGFLRSIWRRIW